MGNDKKSKSSGGHSGGGPNLDLQREEVLKAIILGDSFDRKFAPITLEKPRTLLPLVNIPLLDYTIEFLIAGGIEEIHIFCTSHSDQIQEYIEKSRWSHFKIFTIVEPDCKSVGEALKLIYSHEIIHSDFVLIRGDVVSNMNLSKALKVHRERKEKDKNSIMTMIFKQASPTHRTRSKEDDTVIGCDSVTNELLYYENSTRQKKVKLSLTEIFKEHPSVQLRYDLIDCHIDICSPEVLALFNDNFDFIDIRKDLIPEILTSDILEHTLHAYVLKGEYAARVKDLRTYHSVSKDIIHRWTFPMVPDNNFMLTTTYSLHRQMIYKEKGVKLKSNCVIGEETVIGTGTEVDGGSNICHSVIGRNCVIGRNVTIRGAYIWDNVTIEDGATITSSIVCDQAKICSNATVSKGSIISFGVVVGDGLFIDRFAKFTNCQSHSDSETEEEDDDYDESDQENQGYKSTLSIKKSTAPFNMGIGGKGKKWILPNEKHNEITERDEADSLSESEIDSTDCSDSDDDNNGCNKKKKKKNSPKNFVEEVQATVLNSIEAKHTLENMHIEIHSLRLAYVKDALDCVLAIFPVLLAVEHKSKSQKEIDDQIKARIKTYAPVIFKFSLDQESLVDLVFAIQDFCDTNQTYKPFFKNILFYFYTANLTITEEAILKWAEETENDEEADQYYINACSDFIKWLKSADEEEEDSESEESEEDSSDDEEQDESEDESSSEESE